VRNPRQSGHRFRRKAGERIETLDALIAQASVGPACSPASAANTDIAVISAEPGRGRNDIRLGVSRVGMKTYPLIPPYPPHFSSAEKEERRGVPPRDNAELWKTESCGHELARNVRLLFQGPYP
jgi:hypothetical protein